jgi:queuine tRNA-ribosyltransferase subunit QTRTD1
MLGSLLNKVVTPNYTNYTVSGTPPHLTTQMFRQHLPNINVLQLSAAELMNNSTIAATINNKSQVNQGYNLKDYLNLKEFLLYFNIRDSILDGYGPNNDHSESLYTSQGIIRLTNSHYLNSIHNIYRPDVFVALTDELDINNTNNRLRKSITRSLKWLDETIQYRKDQLQNTENQSNSQPALFANIIGGNLLDYRVAFVKELLQAERLSHLHGFVISGLNTGESADTRHEILKAVINDLPADKPRVVSNLGAPWDVLSALDCGVDIFESNYPYSNTMLGYAVIFPLSSQQQPAEMRLNLNDKQFEAANEPILANCACFTCKNHSRGYIHHLLHSHEMNAAILLDIHNHYHYDQFFQQIQYQIVHNSGNSFIDWRNNMLSTLLDESATISSKIIQPIVVKNNNSATDITGKKRKGRELGTKGNEATEE